MSLDDRVRSRVQALTARTAAQILYRQVTRTDSSEPAINPPIYNGAKVSGSYVTGVTTLNLRGAPLRGMVLPGDKFLLGATTYTISNTVVAAKVTNIDTLTGVQITPALAADAADGDAIAFSFAADTPTNARISSFPQALINGTLIQVGDLRVIIAAADIPTITPKTTDFLVIDGVQRNIINSTPGYAASQVALWTIQAR